MNSKVEIAIKYGMSFIGKPYIWGGDDPIHGFDCSGLVQEILAAVGLDPSGDQSAQALFDIMGAQYARGFVSPGALVFFGKSVKEITHVGFAIDGIHMIEAGGGGSKTKTAIDAAAQNAFIRIRPIKRRADLVAIVHPPY